MLVSRASDGTLIPAQARVLSARVSGDGRFVVFVSDAGNLVPDHANAFWDVFVHDTNTGVTEQVSVSNDGVYGNQESADTYPGADISYDGRYVVFQSRADNLVDGDANGYSDIFMRDRTLGSTTLVSVSSGGAQANGNCYRPSVSYDGRDVAFESYATNLASGDTPDSWADIFVHDRDTGQTALVSQSSAGADADSWSSYPTISGDGGHVVFESDAGNLIPDDTNGVCDVFVRDLEAATTVRAGVGDDEAEPNRGARAGAIGADGRYVAFQSSSTNLVPPDTNPSYDVFVRDLVAGTTTLVSVDSAGSQVSHPCEAPAISGDGSTVAFQSWSPDLVAGDTNNATDLFVHYMAGGSTARASLATDGSQVTSPYSPIGSSGDLSHNAGTVLFLSAADGFVPGDSNGTMDAYVRVQMPLAVRWPR